MSISKRKIATVGAAGVGALAMIGVGAGASWTDSIQASQDVQTGTLHVQIRPDHVADGTVVGNALTLASLGNLGSSFSTTPVQFDVRNVGTLNANTVHLNLSQVSNNAALLSGLNVKITSWAPIWGGGTGTAVPIYDGPLSAFPAGGFDMAGLIHPGEDDAYAISFSAANLPSTAEGGTVTPTVTVDYTE